MSNILRFSEVSHSAYTDFMLEFENLEDHRGGDISQIRRQLRMSVEERVQHMVEVANKFMEIRSYVRFVDNPQV